MVEESGAGGGIWGVERQGLKGRGSKWEGGVD